jgi:hypothetical protein
MSGERYDKGVETRRVLQVSWMSGRWDYCVSFLRAISAVSFRWFSSVARIDARHADGAVLPHTGAKTAQVILSPRPTAAPPRKPEPASTSVPPAPPVQSR